MSTARRLVTLLPLIALAAACGRIPTAPTTGPPPRTAGGAAPPAEFRPVSEPARIYSETQPLYAPEWSSRYVLYDDGTFELQFGRGTVIVRYRGSYETNENVTAFRWACDCPGWEASGELGGERLTVRYNNAMRMGNFKNGVYIRH